jgi:hypothetical protein
VAIGGAAVAASVDSKRRGAPFANERQRQSDFVILWGEAFLRSSYRYLSLTSQVRIVNIAASQLMYPELMPVGLRGVHGPALPGRVEDWRLAP